MVQAQVASVFGVSSLENDGWERDGNVLSTTGDRATLTYTAVAAADGYIALGFSPEGVETAASEDAEPSATGELAALESLEAPIVGAVVPEGIFTFGLDDEAPLLYDCS